MNDIFSDENYCRNYFIFNYIIFVAIFSIILFLYGFFPINYSIDDIATRRSIPKFVEHTRYIIEKVFVKFVHFINQLLLNIILFVE
jgi:hypothetical protein